MTSTEYSQIRRELEQMRQQPGETGRKSAVFDFGLFILLYFFALVLVATALLAAGVSLGRYTALYAIPLAWLGLAWLRKAPGYALMISALGLLFLAAASLLVSRFIAPDGCDKVNTYLLARGWNPFEQTAAAFASSASDLPYGAGWLASQADTRPGASLIIGAGFYALTGNIACGKAFNIAGMAAAVCVAGPLIRDAFKLSGFTAFTAALLAVVNPVTLGQALTYEGDGFMYQTLTVAAAALAYMAYKPEGRFAGMAKAAAFAGVCLAVNIKASALPFCAALCLLCYIARVIGIARSGAPRKTRTKRQLCLLLYFAAMLAAALCALGAATYVTNFLRYGDPFYGMFAAASMNTDLETLSVIGGLPLAAQVFVSLFSPVSAGPLSEIALKIPFTVTASEFSLASPGAVVGGWGVMFSGIFSLSVLVILWSLAVADKRRSRRGWLILLLLLAVFVPAFFVPYLYSARNYLPLFWLPAAALLCLFSAAEDTRLAPPGKGRMVLRRLLGAALCLLLIVNCVTGYNSLVMQARETDTNAVGTVYTNALPTALADRGVINNDSLPILSRCATAIAKEEPR